jgi:hypothetical protein
MASEQSENVYKSLKIYHLSQIELAYMGCPPYIVSSTRRLLKVI